MLSHGAPPTPMRAAAWPTLGAARRGRRRVDFVSTHSDHASSKPSYFTLVDAEDPDEEFDEDDEDEGDEGDASTMDIDG